MYKSQTICSVSDIGNLFFLCAVSDIFAKLGPLYLVEQRYILNIDTYLIKLRIANKELRAQFNTNNWVDILRRLKELLLKKLGAIKINLDIQAHQMMLLRKKFALVSPQLTPLSVNRAISSLGMLVTLGFSLFFALQVLQIPTPAKSLFKNTKGVTLYNNHNSSESYPLFGMKPLVIANIVLRGVVVTDQRKGKAIQGFALLEIDGKPTGPIAVGENMGKGLSLQSINTESATLLYQGNEMRLSLQHAKKPIKPVPN